MDLPTLISRTSPFQISRVFGCFSEDPDQTPHDAVSDLGLHCLNMFHKMSLVLDGLNMIVQLSSCTVRLNFCLMLLYFVTCKCEQRSLLPVCACS